MIIGIIVRHFWYNELTLLSRTVYDISMRLIENKHKVTIITNIEGNYSGEVILDNNLTVKYVENIYDTLKTEKFDILHFYGSLLGAYILLNKVENQRLILNLYTSKVSIRDFGSFKLRDFIYDKRCIFSLNPVIGSFIPNYILRSKLNKCKRIIVESYRFKKFYSSIVNKNKVVRIPHGINFKKFAGAKKEDIENLKKGLGFSKNDFIILYFGHAYLLRGIDDLIFAMKMVKVKISNVKLLLILNKMPGSPMRRIKKLAFKNLPRESIKIIVKYVNNPEDYYGVADVITLPYRNSLELPEYPFVLLEAMASGRPIVTTKIGAIPEIIKNKYNGLLVSPKQPEKLADAVIKLLNDQKFALNLGKNAQKSVKIFDWDNVSKKVLKIYEENM